MKCVEKIYLAEHVSELVDLRLSNTWNDIVRRDRNRNCWRMSQAWAGVVPGLKTVQNNNILEWLAAEDANAKRLLVEIKETMNALLSQRRPQCRLCRSTPAGCNANAPKPLAEFKFGRDQKSRKLATPVRWCLTNTLRQCPEGKNCSGMQHSAGTSDRGKSEWTTADATICPHEGVRALLPGRGRRIDTAIDETLTSDLQVFVSQLQDNDETIGYYGIKHHTQVFKSFGPEPHFKLHHGAGHDALLNIHGENRGLKGAKLLAGDRSGGLHAFGIVGQIDVVGGPHQIAVYRVVVPEVEAHYSRAALRPVCPASTDWIDFAGTTATQLATLHSGSTTSGRVEKGFDPTCEICKQPFNGRGMRCKGGTHFVCMLCATTPPPSSPHQHDPHNPHQHPTTPPHAVIPRAAAPTLPKQADAHVSFNILDFQNVILSNVQMRASLGGTAATQVPGAPGVMWHLQKAVLSRLRSKRVSVKVEMFNLGAAGINQPPVLVGTAQVDLREANRPATWVHMSVVAPPCAKGEKRTRANTRGPKPQLQVKLEIVEF
jgi:hypothetical protein